MIYRDQKGVRIEGVYNRSMDFTSTRHIMAYADSLADAVHWLKNSPTKWSTTHGKDNGATDKWDLNAGYEGALTLARDGWHEGVEKIEFALNAIVPATDRAGRWGWSQTGGSVSVGRYLTGHPKCMKNRTKRQQGSAKVLHMIVNTVASCAVNGDQMANYGAAITGLIDRLENSGRRVHLDCVMAVKAKNDIRMSVGWNVKTASEPVDLSEVAFSIAHPAAFRRIGFSMMEHCDRDTQTMGYGYCADGLPCDVPDYTDGTMIIDGVNHEPDRCNTPKDALRLAIEQINKAAVLAGHATPDTPLIEEEDWLSDLQD